MNPREKYPKLFNCSVSVGEGWWPIIEEICDYVDRVNVTVKGLEDFKILQVKEKFGGLRIYYLGGDETLRGMINMAEIMSFHICEVCGDKAEPSGESWIKTLCEKHSKKEL